MAYTKTIWKNKGELNAPEINKDNLNKIENGISEVNLAGIINVFAGAVAPTGWLLCDGSAVSRTTYADLFNIIGETYGAGDTTTTFNLPNLKGKVVVGVDSTQTEFNTLSKTGGAKTHTLIGNELPKMSLSTGHFAYSDSLWTATGAFTHSNLSGQGTSGTNDEAARANVNQGAQHKFIAGNDQAHNNLQPYISLNYIIKI